MAATPSKMLPLGTSLPSFTLADVKDGALVSAATLPPSPALLVMFICNHCPYVIHIRDVLFREVERRLGKGLAVLAINSNSETTHPQDGPRAMKALVEEHGLKFPFCFDATQDVARSFHAACTPDFFVFDSMRELAYRGRFDAATPGKPDVKVTGEDLMAAVDELLAGTAPTTEQRASIGCNIKWNA